MGSTLWFIYFLQKNECKIEEKAICQTLYKHEVDILSRVEHKNIVAFVNNTEDDSNYYVLTGLCKGGELFGITQSTSLIHPSQNRIFL